jgi:hypothetical protein
MPKNPRGGAPKGNLNASRNGLYTWKTRRMLPPGKDHIGKLVRHEEEDFIQALGGSDHISPQKRSLVADTGFALGLILLAFEEAQTRGSIATTEDGRWDFMPGLGRIKGLLDTRRQNLLALGLEREAKDVDKQIIVRRWSGAEPDIKPADGTTQETQG